MKTQQLRAEILVKGLVQGVGFRYFVLNKAKSLGLLGFTQNLYSGDVLTVVEGPKTKILDLYRQLKIGPMYASVRSSNIIWLKSKNEFNNFEIRH
ncbi:MAG: acylphosphatase [Melioribacteraceae bacterium]|nr:acylphosphatase [Melioribacteraceae bacterium]MCF8265262.1 acylphosphatase [Melioribacteraceae bacterium]MCF8414168.1 acylphosphatase [Melioribacteraceae bacterium]MCF8432533.1 acylphosphatase [Melioribacteraceae bacterium]